MARATTKLSRQALADALDKSRTTLGASGGTGVATFSLQTQSANVPAAIDLLRQVLREPALPAEELEILKREGLTRLEDSRTQPSALAGNLVARRLNAFGVDDVRYEPTFDEQIGRLKAVTREQVERLHREYLGAAHGELVVVGDSDPDAVTALTAGLADWAPKAAYRRIGRPAATAAGGGGRDDRHAGPGQRAVRGGGRVPGGRHAPGLPGPK